MLPEILTVEFHIERFKALGKKYFPFFNSSEIKILNSLGEKYFRCDNYHCKIIIVQAGALLGIKLHGTPVNLNCCFQRTTFSTGNFNKKFVGNNFFN